MLRKRLNNFQNMGMPRMRLDNDIINELSLQIERITPSLPYMFMTGINPIAILIPLSIPIILSLIKYVYNKLTSTLEYKAELELPSINDSGYPNLFNDILKKYINKHSKQIATEKISLTSNQNGLPNLLPINNDKCIFKYDNGNVKISSYNKESEKKADINVLVINGYSRDYILKFMKHVEEEIKNDEINEKRCFKIWNQRNWVSINIKVNKTFDNIFIDVSIKNTILNSLKEFKESKQFYEDFAIPYKKGYIFYGIPGCGKTSLIYAISNYMNTSVYSVSLNSFANVKELDEALRGIRDNTIVLFDDIDLMFQYMVNKRISQSSKIEKVVEKSIDIKPIEKPVKKTLEKPIEKQINKKNGTINTEITNDYINQLIPDSIRINGIDNIKSMIEFDIKEKKILYDIYQYIKQKESNGKQILNFTFDNIDDVIIDTIKIRLDDSDDDEFYILSESDEFTSLNYNELFNKPIRINSSKQFCIGISDEMIYCILCLMKQKDKLLKNISVVETKVIDKETKVIDKETKVEKLIDKPSEEKELKARANMEKLKNIAGEKFTIIVDNKENVVYLNDKIRYYHYKIYEIFLNNYSTDIFDLNIYDINNPVIKDTDVIGTKSYEQYDEISKKDKDIYSKYMRPLIMIFENIFTEDLIEIYIVICIIHQKKELMKSMDILVKPIEKSIDKPIEKSIDKPIEKSIDKPIEKSIDKPIAIKETKVEKLIKKPIEKSPDYKIIPDTLQIIDNNESIQFNIDDNLKEIIYKIYEFLVEINEMDVFIYEYDDIENPIINYDNKLNYCVINYYNNSYSKICRKYNDIYLLTNKYNDIVYSESNTNGRISQQYSYIIIYFTLCYIKQKKELMKSLDKKSINKPVAIKAPESIPVETYESTEPIDPKQQQMLKKLFEFFDGYNNLHGCILILTTNHIDLIDPALIRAGRIDHKIEFKYARETILLDIIVKFYRKQSINDFTQNQQLKINKIITKYAGKISTAEFINGMVLPYISSIDDFINNY